MARDPVAPPHAPAHAPHAPRVFYGWVVVGAVFCILALAYVIWYSFALFLVALVREFGWARAEVAGAFSLFVMMHAICSPISGRLVDRFGSRALVHGGALLVGLALLGCSQMTALWQLYVCFGLLAAAGVTAMGWVSGVALVGRWFSRRLGLAIGVIGAGIGLGTFVGAPPIQWLIEGYGWRTAYLALAVVLALVPQPLALLLRTRPEDLGLQRDGTPPTSLQPAGASPPAATTAAPTQPITSPLPSSATATSETGAAIPHAAIPATMSQPAPTSPAASAIAPQSAAIPQSATASPRAAAPAADPRVVDPVWVRQEWTVKRAIRTRRFQFLFLTFGMTTFGTQQIHAHHAAYLVGSGYDTMLAAMVVGTVGLVSIVGKVLVGTASDAWGREPLFSAGMAAGVAAMLLLLAVGGGHSPAALLFLYGALFALGYSAAPTLTPAITADLFSGKHYGAIYGVLMLCNGLGGATGAWFAGYVFDHTGSYQLAWLVVLADFALASGVVWLVGPRHVLRTPGQARRTARGPADA
jgi:MFS family permease